MENIIGLSKFQQALEIECKSLSTMEDELEEMKKGKIRRFFQDSFEKEQYKLKRKKLEGQIQSKSTFIENETSRLENASTCDIDVLTSFFVRTLSIIEQEEYDEWDFSFETEDCDYVRLIAPKYVCEKIARLYCTGEIYDMDDIEIIDEDENDIGYMLFEISDDCKETDIYDLERQDVPKEYEDNPDVSNMLLRLAELKYKNPNLSDEEAAEEVIKQISTEHCSQKEAVKTIMNKKV